MDRRHFFACILMLLAASAWSAEGLVIAQKYCTNCHGEDGIAVTPASPHLNGQLDSYLIDMMRGFQKKKIPTSVPNHIPAELGDIELEAIAAHYMTVKATRPKQETDPAKVAQGNDIYNTRCADCHIDNGRDADKSAPLLAAQNLEYMLAQTRLFVSGKRKFGFLQDEAFKGLSLDQLDAAAHFFASQDQVGPPKSPQSGKRKRR